MHRTYNQLIQRLERRFNFDVRYFVRGGFWLSLGQIVITLLGLATTALFAHFLSETDYGVYRYLIGLAVLFSSLSLTGIGQAILQTAAQKFFSFYQETLGISFFYSLGITALGILGTGYYFYNDNQLLALGCLLIAFLQPLSNTYQFVPTYLQGIGDFKSSTVLHIIKSSVSTLLSLVALLITENILILLAVYLGSQALTNMLSHWWYKPRENTPTPPEVFQKYLTYAKHTSVRYLILNASFRADTIIIFTQLGAIELAIYTLAIIIPEQIKNSFKNISTLLLPKYAKHTDFTAIKKSIPLRSFQLGIILLAITIVYIIAAPFIYGLLFPKYEQAVLLTQILALSFPAMIALIPSSALEARLNERDLYTLNTVSSVIMVLTTILGILFFGLMGAIIAKVAYRYISLLLSYGIIYRRN